ncbi:hypothetical protein D3C83_252770 [compost metagenome]
MQAAFHTICEKLGVHPGQVAAEASLMAATYTDQALAALQEAQNPKIAMATEGDLRAIDQQRRRGA